MYGGGTGLGIGARSPSRSIPKGFIILFKYNNFIYFMGSIGNVSNFVVGLIAWVSLLSRHITMETFGYGMNQLN